MDKRRDIAKRAVVSEKKVICSSYWMKFETEIIFGIKDFRNKIALNTKSCIYRKMGAKKEVS